VYWLRAEDMTDSFDNRNSSFGIPMGLLASGGERMEQLIEFRETLLFYQDPANGKRDMKRKNGLKLCVP
jgi:hypothetical protein